jgi:hypothetical protein
MGIFNAANARPHPDADGVGPRDVSHEGHTVRVWVLVSDDDDSDAILERALDRGAEELWRHHYWKEFNGFNSAFKDPWGNTRAGIEATTTLNRKDWGVNWNAVIEAGGVLVGDTLTISILVSAIKRKDDQGG